MKYLYNVFNLIIKSEICLPQFTPSQEKKEVDISIRLGDIKSIVLSDYGSEHIIKLGEKEVYYFWEQIGSFLVKNGNEIIVEPLPNVEKKLLRLPLIGTVFATLLQQREMMVLHASAVSINNKAVAFLGWKGAGKSTTAAILYKRGHPMISDDIVAIEHKENRDFLVVPGFPNFKLMPETASSVLLDNPETLSQCFSGSEKRYRSFSDNFLRKSIPLKAIYALEEGTDLNIQQLSPQESITNLIANTYTARYGNLLLQGNHGALYFNQCANIVNKIPVYRLERPKSFHLLNEVAVLVESQH